MGERIKLGEVNQGLEALEALEAPLTIVSLGAKAPEAVEAPGRSE